LLRLLQIFIQGNAKEGWGEEGQRNLGFLHAGFGVREEMSKGKEQKKKSKKEANRWTLDVNEVGLGWNGSASYKRKKRRQSRALDARSKQIILTHIPTGLSVIGDIPPGNYTRKKERELTEEMWKILWPKLELKVARHLHIPGY
jgi:hypothetical protein